MSRQEPRPSAQELETEASRLVGRLLGAFADMSQRQGLDEPASPTNASASKVLGKGAHPGRLLEWLRWEEDGSLYRDILADLKPAVVRYVRTECKDGPTCGLTGNDKDAKYSMIRDQVLAHLFRALNQDISTEQSQRLAKLWKSPQLYDPAGVPPAAQGDVSQLPDGEVSQALAEENMTPGSSKPQDPQLDRDTNLCNLICEYEMRGDIEYAIELQDKRLQNVPSASSSAAWYDYARFLMRTGPKQLEAEKALRRALQDLTGAQTSEDVIFSALLLLNQEQPCSVSVDEEPLARFDAARMMLEEHVKSHNEAQVVFFFLFLAYALEAVAASREEAEQHALQAEEQLVREVMAAEAAEAAAAAAAAAAEEEAAEAAAAAEAEARSASPKPQAAAQGTLPAAATDDAGKVAEGEGEEEQKEPDWLYPEPIGFSRSELLASQAARYLLIAKASADELPKKLEILWAPEPVIEEPPEEEEGAEVVPEPPPPPEKPHHKEKEKDKDKEKGPSRKSPSPPPPSEPVDPDNPEGLPYYGPEPKPVHPDHNPQDDPAVRCLDLMLHFGIPSFIQFLLTVASDTYDFVEPATTAKGKVCHVKIIEAIMLERAWPRASTELTRFFELCEDCRHACVLLGECHFQADREGISLEEMAALPYMLAPEQGPDEEEPRVLDLPSRALIAFEAALKAPRERKPSAEDAAALDRYQQQNMAEDMLIHLRMGLIHFRRAQKASFVDVEVIDKVMEHYGRSIQFQATAEAWLHVGICNYHKAHMPDVDRARRQEMLLESINYFAEANLIDVADAEISCWLAICSVEVGHVQVAKQAVRQVLQCVRRLSAQTGLRLAAVLLRHSNEALAGRGERPSLVQHCRYAPEAAELAKACMGLEAESEEVRVEGERILAEAEMLMGS